MSKVQLLETLVALQLSVDIEAAHGEADNALLEYIGDPDITSAYAAIEKGYA